RATMRHVKLRRPHNRQVRRDGRRFLEQLPAGSEATVTEQEFQAFRDRFVEVGAAADAAVETAQHSDASTRKGSVAGAGSSPSGTGDHPDENDSGGDGAVDAPDIE